MDVKLSESWKELLKEEFEKEYFISLVDFVKREYKEQLIYPKAKNIFKALDSCPVDGIKVVIIGQDPYHGENQANGLCFSVEDHIAIPPSLQNIFKEIHRDLGIGIPKSGNLERWAEQGVLLINSVLTVRHSQAASHQNRGWEIFTDAVVSAINSRCDGVVYMLWGNYAHRKGAVIDTSKNLVLKSVHPSPLSAHRGFIGCGHFSLANNYLQSKGKSPIKW